MRQKKNEKKITNMKRSATMLNPSSIFWKTQLCRGHAGSGCRWTKDECSFAHGERDRRDVKDHPRYKTELCKNDYEGFCENDMCTFAHGRKELRGGMPLMCTFYQKGECTKEDFCKYAHTEEEKERWREQLNKEAEESKKKSTPAPRGEPRPPRIAPWSRPGDFQDEYYPALPSSAASNQLRKEPEPPITPPTSESQYSSRPAASASDERQSVTPNPHMGSSLRGKKGSWHDASIGNDDTLSDCISLSRSMATVGFKSRLNRRLIGMAAHSSVNAPSIPAVQQLIPENYTLSTTRDGKNIGTELMTHETHEAEFVLVKIPDEAEVDLEQDPNTAAYIACPSERCESVIGFACPSNCDILIWGFRCPGCRQLWNVKAQWPIRMKHVQALNEETSVDDEVVYPIHMNLPLQAISPGREERSCKFEVETKIFVTVQPM